MRRFDVRLALLTAAVAGAATTSEVSAQASQSRAVNRTASRAAETHGPRNRVVNVTGVVTFFPDEGGFYAVRGDDGVTYDPVGGLPDNVQRDGLRVRLVARRLNVGGAHQVGPAVEVIRVKPLDAKSGHDKVKSRSR